MKNLVFFAITYFSNNFCYAQLEYNKYYSFGTTLLFECYNERGYSSYILNNNGFYIERLFNCNFSDTIYKGKFDEIKFNKTVGKLIYYDSMSRILVNDITKTLDVNDSAYTNLYRVVYKIGDDSITFLFLSSLSKLGFERKNKFFSFHTGENQKYKFYLFSIDYFACELQDETSGYRINQNYYNFKEK